MELHTLIQQIQSKADENTVFLTALLANPKETLAADPDFAEFSARYKEVKVLEQGKEETLYLVLDAKASAMDVELNETELDIITGGSNPGSILQNT